MVTPLRIPQRGRRSDLVQIRRVEVDLHERFASVVAVSPVCSPDFSLGACVFSPCAICRFPAAKLFFQLAAGSGGELAPLATTSRASVRPRYLTRREGLAPSPLSPSRSRRACLRISSWVSCPVLGANRRASAGPDEGPEKKGADAGARVFFDDNRALAVFLAHRVSPPLASSPLGESLLRLSGEASPADNASVLS